MKTIHIGQLLTGDDLESEYSHRKKTRLENSIDIKADIPDGWELLREYKTRKRIFKEKPIDQLLEDQVWVLLHDVGIGTISSKDFSLVLRSKGKTKKTKQIDVLGIDGDTIFVVECKSKEVLGKKSLKKDIAEYSLNKRLIEAAIRNGLQKKGLEFVHVFATENIVWDDNDLIDAEENHIIVWNEYDLMALRELAKIAGEGAKYQIYNRVFFNKKLKDFEVKVPALKSSMGGITYYTFAAHPEDLLKISYVHHRSGRSTFVDLSNSYQRMIKWRRVKNIESFIQDGGFFPNSIIINFSRKLAKEEQIGDKKHLDQLSTASKPVAISLPPYYGCAWIIDGQHRLYGYADTEEKYSETVPVVAFVDINKSNKGRKGSSLEARLFVEINKNQKSIPPELLWDLYEDLYSQSTDELEVELYSISRIAKLLNNEPDSPFFNQIDIPQENNNGIISLYAICNTIKQQKLVNKREELLVKDSLEETIQYCYERLKIFFEIFRETLPDEWDAGELHYIKTNSGVTVLLGIFRDLISTNLSKKEISNKNSYKKALQKFLEPLFFHLISIDQSTIDQYRGAGGAGQKSRQVRLELTEKLIEANIGFRSNWYDNSKKKELDSDAFERTKKGLTYYLEKVDEGKKLEFKGSLSLDLDRYLLGDGNLVQNEDLIDDGVLKTIVGFLNKQGGDLVIGVLEEHRYLGKANEDVLAEFETQDGKILVGIEIEYGKDGWDGYSQRIVNFIENRIGSDVIDSELVQIKKLPHKGIDYCEIVVIPSENKQFLNNKFYVRREGKTDLLEGPDIDRYWENRKL